MTNELESLRTALADRYRIERELGRGGMARVYLAQDLKHHRPVAVKVLNPELSAAVGSQRFLQEIEVTAGLDHPHVLPLLDSGDADGFLYYVMPYVHGESLRDRLVREKQLPIDDAVQITREVADALDYAHHHSVVHRDVKPENIMLAAGHARMADFGIARAITAAGGTQLTATGIAVGTPAYMSPEQATGSLELDGRSDLYSLGCVLYEMLAGRPPFTGSARESIVYQHLSVDPTDIKALRPSVPGWLADTTTRAMAKTPADRFRTASELVEALEPQKSMPSREERPRRRWARRLALVGSAVALVAVVASLVILRPWRKAIVPAGLTQEHMAIAVLPFQNLSAEGPQYYFAGGLHDEILTQLSKVTALNVISRTSVMGYAGTQTPLRQIASELGVGSIVEGSVQVVGGRLRVNVQLIDAATDQHLWAERYDRTLDDAFAIQSDVAQQIVAAVGATLRTSEKELIVRAPTQNAEAYRFYLQAQEYVNRPGYLRQNYESAQQLLEQALGLDPIFALAHAELSQVHGGMYWQRHDPSPQRVAQQREEAEAALRLAPELPQAHIAMGVTRYWSQLDYTGALAEFDIALRGLPNDAKLLSWFGAVHRRLGNWDKVYEAYEQAVLLDPRAANLYADLGGNTFRHTGRYAEAVRAYNRALALAPDLDATAVDKGWVFVMWQGELDSLRSTLSRLPLDVRMGGIGTARSQSAYLLLCERHADSLLALLLNTREVAFDEQTRYFPTSLYAGWAHQLNGNEVLARAAFESTLLLLDSVMVALPDDYRVHVARGLALAGLGRREGAIDEARWLAQSVVYREDAFWGPWLAEERSRILAQAGAADDALDEIERILAGPSWLMTVHILQLEPLWDPIRDHPRFRALLAKYSGG
jgi:serine/threonine-protein kinase